MKINLKPGRKEFLKWHLREALTILKELYAKNIKLLDAFKEDVNVISKEMELGGTRVENVPNWYDAEILKKYKPVVIIDYTDDLVEVKATIEYLKKTLGDKYAYLVRKTRETNYQGVTIKSVIGDIDYSEHERLIQTIRDRIKEERKTSSPTGSQL